jgi:hypothetical protein
MQSFAMGDWDFCASLPKQAYRRKDQKEAED